MCHLVYTNFQRQGAVSNMTVKEVQDAKVSREYRVISVWDHKTANAHGPARLAIHVKIYQLLERYVGGRDGADIVFLTNSGAKVTHIGYELEQFSECFGKKFTVTPTENRKQVATTVGLVGTHEDERNAAKHMSHSYEVHRAAYQHDGGPQHSVARSVNLLNTH